MPPIIRAALLALPFLIAACDRAGEPDASLEPQPPPTHDEYREALADSALAETLLGRGWLEAADFALAAPAVLALPHYERGVFLPTEVRSIGIAFDAIEGQGLHITLAVTEDSEGQLFTDVFFLDWSGDVGLARHVTSLADLEGGVVPLERSGRYVLRLQPELLASIDYQLRMELDAALAFPVIGHGHRSVGSIFGDPRDGGRRRHEGIDIFAPRATPVVAVVDGAAIPRISNLGGKTVWLRGAGKSFYYAHLDEVAIDGRQGVAAGDVLGFVGNTGNAVTAPPHLHFGIYRRGRGAIDPLPYLASRTFAIERGPVAYAPGFAVVTAAELNLRPGPGTREAPIGRLPEATPVRVVGATDDWLRVRTTDGADGWIHRDYQAALSGADRQHRAPGDAWLLSAPHGPPVGRVRPETTLHLFTEIAGWRLVGASAEEPLGWLPSPFDSQLARR